MFLLYCRNEDHEPVKILRTFVEKFLRGRPLDILDESGLLEGETTEIFVSCFNVYTDGMDELLNKPDHDYSLPLDVTFNGEMAEDLGGPRKEFLSSMVRQIKDKLFVKNDPDGTFVLHQYEIAENRSHYFGARIIFG